MSLSYFSLTACLFDDFIELFAIEVGKSSHYMLHICFPLRFPDDDLAGHQAVGAEHSGQDQGKTGKYPESAAGAVQQYVGPPFGLGQPDAERSQSPRCTGSQGKFSQKLLLPEE